MLINNIAYKFMFASLEIFRNRIKEDYNTQSNYGIVMTEQLWNQKINKSTAI